MLAPPAPGDISDGGYVKKKALFAAKLSCLPASELGLIL